MLTPLIASFVLNIVSAFYIGNTLLNIDNNTGIGIGLIVFAMVGTLACVAMLIAKTAHELEEYFNERRIKQ